jgi:hypothetical protein
MFEKLKQFLQGAPPPVAPYVDDPGLGRLAWSKDDKLWVSDPKHRDCGFAFQIAGTPEPDQALVAHAADILAGRDTFVREVSTFLVRELEETRYMSAFADEIRQLTIETVCLFWPDRPNDGMIWFDGPDEFRVWRCDYIDRKPKDLGFDD